MLLTFIWEIPDLNPSKDASYSETVDGSLSLHANAGQYFKSSDGHSHILHYHSFIQCHIVCVTDSIVK